MKHIILFTICYSLFAGYGQGSGRALAFDGNDYLNLGGSVLNGVRTIEFWICPSVTFNAGAPSSQTIFGRDNPSAGNSGYTTFTLIGNDGVSPGREGCLGFHRFVGATPHVIFTDVNSWEAGRWYHIVGVLHPVNGMQLYVNGELQTGANPTTNAVDINTHVTMVGKHGEFNIRYFRGVVDEVRIWTDALGESRIRHAMCERLVGSEAGLRAYYRMDEGADNTCTATADVCDATGNGHHGTKF